MVIPLFLKFDSYGEYIFDFEWAQFFSQVGLEYYPKGLVAVPFTPANGKRILYDRNLDLKEICSILIPELLRFCEKEGLSGVHFLFLEKEESEVLSEYGFATRLSHQYHWMNGDYSNFDDYLGAMKSKKRMQIKREREIVRSRTGTPSFRRKSNHPIGHGRDLGFLFEYSLEKMGFSVFESQIFRFFL